MAFVENFTAFFNTADFAVTAKLSGVTVRGIFDNASITTDAVHGMASVSPVFTLPTSDVPADPVGRSLECNDVVYRIAAHDQDGTGVSVLTLEYTT